MGEFKHLVVVKFKENVAVEEILTGLEKLVAEIEAVKSYEWGQDLESHEMLTQGFTHAILMTFDKKEDYTVFLSHPKHAEFSATFSTVIEKIVLLDFPATLVKPAVPATAPIPDEAPVPPPPAPEVKAEVQVKVTSSIRLLSL